MSDSLWADSSARPHLDADQVHIWRAELDLSEEEFARLESTLSTVERLQATRFRFKRDARRFIATRGILRDLLSRYSGIAPAELAFVRGPHVKPSLASSEINWLRFNSSHSGNLALFAFACNRDIGIDLEWIQPELADWKIAIHFFAEGEVSALQKLDSNIRTAAFFACWTRKEAYVKALGEGVSDRLRDFEVTVAPDQSQPNIINGKGSWSLRSLNVADDFASACVVEGTSDWNLHLCNWRPTSHAIAEAASLLGGLQRYSAGGAE